MKTVCVKNYTTSKDKDFIFIIYVCIISVSTGNFVIVGTDILVNKILCLNIAWTVFKYCLDTWS